MRQWPQPKCLMLVSSSMTQLLFNVSIKAKSYLCAPHFHWFESRVAMGYFWSKKGLWKLTCICTCICICILKQYARVWGKADVAAVTWVMKFALYFFCICIPVVIFEAMNRSFWMRCYDMSYESCAVFVFVFALFLYWYSICNFWSDKQQFLKKLTVLLWSELWKPVCTSEVTAQV